MIWWIAAAIAGLVVLSKASPQTVQPGAVGGTSPAIRFPGQTPDIKEIGPFMFNEGPPLPGPAVNAPQASTTLTDFPVNLASAFNTYAHIYLNKSVSGPTPVSGSGSAQSSGVGGGGYYGGGGTGGGGGSLGCPIEGTVITPVGGYEFESSDFTSDEWLMISAGEFSLTATPSHELVTMRGKLRLSEVKIGDLVVTEDGERKVSMLGPVKITAKALRIHVPHSHLYFASGILSHNKA